MKMIQDEDHRCQTAGVYTRLFSNVIQYFKKLIIQISYKYTKSYINIQRLQIYSLIHKTGVYTSFYYTLCFEKKIIVCNKEILNSKQTLAKRSISLVTRRTLTRVPRVKINTLRIGGTFCSFQYTLVGICKQKTIQIKISKHLKPRFIEQYFNKQF